MSVMELTGKNFDTAINSPQVLVDFYATWCGPCRMQTPVLEAFAERHGANVKVGRLDIDTAPAVAERFGVASVPTFLVFREGKETARVTGVQSVESLLKLVGQ